MVPVAGGGELEFYARSALAKTSKDPDVLAALAADEDELVRRRVAENPNATAAALELLAREENYEVRRRVAKHPNTSVATLWLLAGDEDDGVRYGVGNSPSAPTAILESLAGDTSDVVRRRVIENPNTPISVVAELLGDPSSYVSPAARARFISWVQETLDLGSAPTEQLIDMLVALKAWELDPKDPAITAAVVLCN